MKKITKKTALRAVAAAVIGTASAAAIATTTLGGAAAQPSRGIDAASLAAQTLPANQQPWMANYAFTTIDNQADPTFNQLLGINDDGRIAGYFGSGQPGHPNKGYTLASPYRQGDFTNENFPGSAQTQVTGINGEGLTVGFWADAAGDNSGFVDVRGHFTNVADPLAAGTTKVNQLLGINDFGVAAGFYNDAAGNAHAYLYNIWTRHFTPLTPPGAVSATATGINNRGDVSGFLTLANGNTEGFVLRSWGREFKFIEFEFPGSTNTQVLGINDDDELVGQYTDAAKATHGFTLNDGWRFQSIDDPNGVGSTTVNGVDDHGQLVGFYVDKAGNTDGFLANRAAKHHS